MSAFKKGIQNALEDLEKLAGDGARFDELLEVTGQTVDRELQKNASEQDQSYKLGVDTACYSFLKEACDYHGNRIVQDQQQAVGDIVKTAAEGQNDFQPQSADDPFWIGKVAALEDMVGMFEKQASLADYLQTIKGTLQTPLEKTASGEQPTQEDQLFRLGIESTCYDFLKHASASYGAYDVQDEQAAIQHVLEKVAASQSSFGADPEVAARMKAREKRRQAAGNKTESGQFKTPYEPSPKEQILGGRDEEAARQAARENMKPGLTEKTLGEIGSDISDRAGQIRSDVAGHIGENKGLYGAGAATAAALPALYYGYKKIRGGDEEEQKAASQKPTLGGGQEKTASQNPRRGDETEKTASQHGSPSQQDINNSIKTLQDAGLIEE